MKKALLFAAFIALAAHIALAQTNAGANTREILASYDFFSKQYPRTEGSVGERRSIAYIEHSLSALGVGYSLQNFHELEATHSFSSSIEVNLHGKSPDTLLVIVPLDHPQGASKSDDGSINLALALGLIETLHGESLPISLKVLFLGGEFGSGPSYPIGTKQFLSNFYPDYPVAALYLDFGYIPDRTNITGGGRRIIAPYWLINRCSSAMDKAGLFYLLRGNENQIFRLGLIANPPQINPYLQAGYPALELSSLPGHLPRDQYARWIGTFLSYMQDFIAASSAGFPTNWDRHYLFFQARFFSFILTEREYVVLVILILALLLAYPIFFRDRFLRYLRTIGRNLLSIPLLLALVFLFLLLGTLLVEGIFLIRNFPTIWMNKPLLFFSCKIAAALFLFALLYRFLKNLPFSRNGRFYSAGSILLLLIDSIVLGLLDFSLAYYFVWALIWAVLFSIVRWRWFKIAFILIATGWLVKALVDVFTLPALDVVRAILLSRVKGNIIIALIILPFLFMIIRVDLLFRHPRRHRGITVIRAIDTLLGISTAGLVVYLSLYPVYGPGRPQPISVQERMNLNTDRQQIEVTSPAPIRRIELKTPDIAQAISTRARSYTTSLKGARSLLGETTQSSAFLDRKRIDLKIDPVGKPYSVQVKLSSSKQIVIFDANFPFSYSPTGQEASIHVGVNPPFPLDVQFTLPQSANVRVTLVLTYNELPVPLEVTGTDITVQKTLVVQKELTIEAKS